MDVLKKVFQVGKYIAAGFAGDVRAGMVLVTDLSTFSNPCKFQRTSVGTLNGLQKTGQTTHDVPTSC